MVRQSTVFTTHTPVPAGHDVFPHYLIDRYFSGYWDQLNLSRDEFLRLGETPGIAWAWVQHDGPRHAPFSARQRGKP